MPSPNAFTIGDRLRSDDNHWVTVRAFVKPAGGRQLVRVEYPDGSCRNKAFESLRTPTDVEQWFADRGVYQVECPRCGYGVNVIKETQMACNCGYIGPLAKKAQKLESVKTAQKLENAVWGHKWLVEAGIYKA